MPNINVALAGSTGLVGSHILKTLLANPSINTVHAFSRRALDASATGGTDSAGSADNPNATSATAKLHPIISTDTSTWPASFPPATQLFITALGTTRANAGSLQAQRAIDVDLNVALARAAAASNTNNTTNNNNDNDNDNIKAENPQAAKVAVLISSAGATAGSMMPYSDMKGTLEQEVSAMPFDRVVIVRPGLIVGERQEGRAVEGSLRALAKRLGAVSGGRLKDFWAQDADVIARAAVVAGVMAAEGRVPAAAAAATTSCGGGGKDGKVWVVDQKQILKLGKEGAA